MIIPNRIDTIRQYRLPSRIAYERENYHMRNLLQKHGANFSGIYTFRTLRPIYDPKFAESNFVKLCKATNMNFCAWKEFGKGGWHFHMFGHNYNFKNIWKGHISYKKFRSMSPSYSNYFFKQIPLGDYKLPKEPKFYFKWNNAVFRDEFKIKLSKLYIDLKIVITLEDLFFKYFKAVEEKFKQVIKALESSIYCRTKVATTIALKKDKFKIEIYLPKTPYDKLVVEKLKWLLVKYFGNLCAFMSLLAYKANETNDPAFSVRLSSRVGFLKFLSHAKHKPKINHVNVVLKHFGKQFNINKFFTMVFSQKYEAKGLKEIFSDCKKHLRGTVALYDLNYCKIISGCFENEFPMFVEDYSKNTPIDFSFHNWRILPRHSNKVACGTLPIYEA